MAVASGRPSCSEPARPSQLAPPCDPRPAQPRCTGLADV